MYSILIIIFILGYLAIALEHIIKIDKAATALLTGTLCWTVILVAANAFFPELGTDGQTKFIHSDLLEHLGEISEILFFLLGAMTIVELIDAHGGFAIITDRVSTTSKTKLLWFFCGITFFLSAVLDNLTTAIVMATLLKKLLRDKKDIWFFGGMIVIAANAGGAWSPIGDVTTIMLWISGRVTAGNIITTVFVPSILCVLTPLVVVSLTMRGTIALAYGDGTGISQKSVTSKERLLVFWCGIGGLLMVPVIKSITHLPPFMCILLLLSLLWTLTEYLHRKKEAEAKRHLIISGIIKKIDTPSVLFFLGILLAVAGLQTVGILADLALYMQNHLDNLYVLNTLIGLLSSIVDNVPLVAGAIGMYPLHQYPQDHLFWELLSYCAGTGGSALIIGSAAGVAIMGILKVDFIWYAKRISWLALLGYASGIVYLFVTR
ncbi:sodium:proton antiporter NhaD [Galbibacter sp. PAP.153]|uniref:sodium:proton antiporter NhaD n=1 Tax=Galbibacter sp. PAP.153 TaxID=3104623 RepID=UPI0030086432